MIDNLRHPSYTAIEEDAKGEKEVSKGKEKQERKKGKPEHKVTYIKRIINTIRGPECSEYNCRWWQPNKKRWNSLHTWEVKTKTRYCRRKETKHSRGEGWDAEINGGDKNTREGRKKWKGWPKKIATMCVGRMDGGYRKGNRGLWNKWLLHRNIPGYFRWEIWEGGWLVG